MSSKTKIVYLDFDDTKNPLLGGGQATATREVGERLAQMGMVFINLLSKPFYPIISKKYKLSWFTAQSTH